jgi:hypothetical protein
MKKPYMGRCILKEDIMKKPWYKSKTVWVNIIAVIVLIVQTQTGLIVPENYQTWAIIAINFLLRLITKEELTT